MRRLASAAVCAAFCALTAGAADAACRQALVLGLDVSGSVDAQEYRLQLDGLASALESPDVLERLLAMPSAPVRLAVFEWSSFQNQNILLGWTAVQTRADVARIAEQLRGFQRNRQGAGSSMASATALGTAMQFAGRMLAGQSECWARTVDISGDGKNNSGNTPRRVTLDPDITVNGLVIGADDPASGDARQVEIGELSNYYRVNVLRGPRAFVETALGYDDFERAMTRKLIRELEGLVIGRSTVPTRP